MIPARRRALGAIVAVLVSASAHGFEVPLPGTTNGVDVSGRLDGLAIGRLGGPGQLPSAAAEFRFDHRASRTLRFHLTLRTQVGGPYVDPHPGVMDLGHEFQNHSPSGELNEAYADWNAGELSVRAGVQKFAWGKLDGIPPTDVVTPRDLHDPLVRDYEESKIGIPAVAATYALPPLPRLDVTDLRATLAYVPIAVPSRLPLTEERWFPPSIKLQPVVRFSAAEVDQVLGVPAGLRVPVTLTTLNDAPPRTLGEGGLAFRLAGAWRDMDWDAYHYSGANTGPDAQLTASLKVSRTYVDPRGVAHIVAPADVHLVQAHDTMHMTGADWSAALGGATVRAEVAWFVNRPYLRITSDLFSPQALSALPGSERSRIRTRLAAGERAAIPLGDLYADRNAVQWGVGADYLVHGFLPLLQVTQLWFTDSGPRQLYSDPETQLIASVRRKFWQDTLELEIRSLVEIERGAWTLGPRATYRLGDHWRFRFGYLAIGGPLQSTIGQYHANDEFVMEARYYF